jgi:hypothetical protein
MEFKPFSPMKPMTTERWWPVEISGSPDSTGASEGWRYAYFEHTAIYETGSTRISGIAQSSGAFPTFRGEDGQPVQLASLKLIS